MSLEVIVEVKQATGAVKSGIKNGKPWAIAEQEAAVFVAGADYPTVGLIQGKTSNLAINGNSVLYEVAWVQPGRYTAKIVLATDSFRRIVARLNDRDMKPVVEAVPAKPAQAKAA